MKNKKVFTLLSLAIVSGILSGCQNGKGVTPGSDVVPSKEEVFAKGSVVYLNEDGKTSKINDPEDPTVNVVKELRMSQNVLSLYYSSKASDNFAETKQLSVTGYPLKAAVGTLVWTSSDEAVASVDQTGLVTAKKEGVAVITATSPAGLKSSCRVVVNDTFKPLATAAKSAAKILATQNDPSFEAVEKIYVDENYSSVSTKNGVVQSSAKAHQQMWASVNDAYFRILSDDEEIKTAGGSVVPSNSSYIFYTTDTYFSYIFCNSDGKSNYMKMDQLYLVDEGYSPFEALGEVLQSFFVKGSAIMTDQYTDILGQKQLNGGYGNPKYKGSLGENSGSFAFNQVSTGGGTISFDEAEDWGIPAGTRVTINDDIRYLWEDNLLSMKIIDEVIDYEIDGDVYQEIFHIDYNYKGRGVELLWPDTKAYTEVDSIFDL